MCARAGEAMWYSKFACAGRGEARRDGAEGGRAKGTRAAEEKRRMDVAFVVRVPPFAFLISLLPNADLSRNAA